MLGQPFCWLFDTTRVKKPMSNMRLIKHQKIHQLSQLNFIKHKYRERRVVVEKGIQAKATVARSSTCHTDSA